MTRISTWTAVAAVLALASCSSESGSPDPDGCGGTYEPCCAAAICDHGLFCDGENVCSASAVPCGANDQACCSGSSCDAALVCTNGTCGQPPPCGGAGEACCAASTCDTGLLCTVGTCGTSPPPPCTDPFGSPSMNALRTPEALAAADMDGDGKIDLLVGDGGGVTLHRGNGDGTFAQGTHYTGASAYRMAIADLDEDGLPDLAGTSFATGEVAIAFGKGLAGTKTRIAVGKEPVGLTAADLNADGHLDLAVANSNFAEGNTVSVLLGNGDGTFQSKVDYPAGKGPWDVAAGDVDGDGKKDLVVVNYWMSTWDLGAAVAVLRGNGDGTFQAAVLVAGGSNLSRVALADLDGDLALDVIVSNLQNGSPPGRSVFVLYGPFSGTAFARRSSFVTGSNPYTFVADDLDGDGATDLAVADYGSNAVSVLAGADGAFLPRTDYQVGFSPTGVAAGDFDGDGVKDLAVATYAAKRLQVLRGTGGAAFEGTRAAMAGAEPIHTAAGDVDGDGDVDLVVVHRAGGVGVLLGDGAGGFAAPADFATGAGPVAAAVGDLDGDGAADVVVANRTAGTVSVLLSNGDGTLQAKVDYAAGAQPSDVAVADLDGDLALDVVVASTSDDRLAVLLGNGDGTLAAKVEHVLSAGPTTVLVADATGDGRLDLVATTDVGAAAVVLPGNGDGTFGAERTKSRLWGVVAVGVGELDGTAPLELAVADSSSVALYSGIDDATSTVVSTSAGTAALEIADLDGDGAGDLALWSRDPNTYVDRLRLVLDPLATSRVYLAYPTGGAVRALTVADLDGDGRPDAAMPSQSDETVRIYLNACGE